jgi:hypothetical protein
MKVETYKPIGRPYRMRQKSFWFFIAYLHPGRHGEVQAISENACLFFVFSLTGGNILLRSAGFRHNLTLMVTALEKYGKW